MVCIAKLSDITYLRKSCVCYIIRFLKTYLKIKKFVRVVFEKKIVHFLQKNPFFGGRYMRKRKSFHLSRNFIHRRKNRPSGVFYHSERLPRYRHHKPIHLTCSLYTSLAWAKKHGFRVLCGRVCMHDKKNHASEIYTSEAINRGTKRFYTYIILLRIQRFEIWQVTKFMIGNSYRYRL